MELKRVVITGLGAITPLGNDVATTWENAIKGVSGAGPITHFDASLFKTQFACEVKGFNAADHFDRKKLRQLDLYAQYAIVAARQAVEDSGIEKEENLNRNRVGVIVAAGIGGLHTFEEEAGYYAKLRFILQASEASTQCMPSPPGTNHPKLHHARSAKAVTDS